MTAATIIVEGTFREGWESAFAEYTKRVREVLDKHHGKVVRRQLVTKTLYGTHSPNLFMVIDFADEAVAKRIFFEPDYLALVPLRDRVFKDFRMWLARAGEA
jgi:uncharacterized protein (DUF1330 family)